MKSYIDKKHKLEQQVKNWEEEKEILIKQQQIKQEKKQIKDKYKKERRKTTTTKFLTFFLFLNCTLIEFFTLYIILKQINLGLEVDLVPLQMLITAIVTEVISFAVYSIKSLKENTKNGIIYQTAMMDYQNSYEDNDNEQEEILG